jgi:thiaminase/transcriptional activator TenA
VSAPQTTAELRSSVSDLWDALVAHPFPAGLADGTLAPERFRFYITQNLAYLPDYARMIAAAASRSTDSTALEEYTAALVNIVGTEIPENKRLQADIVAVCGPVTVLDGIPAPATVTYTSWLLSIAALGDAADISAALLPCAWTYGEIARALEPTAVEHPVYRAWISFFASDAYDGVVTTLRASFDRDLRAMTTAKRERLAEIFRSGCRMERLFWDQALSGSHWPDLTD